MKKMTKDLQPGDKVVWGEGNPECDIDTVISVEKLGGSVLQVNVKRRGFTTYFYAGNQSVQNVLD